MRDNVRDLVKLVAESLEIPEPIVEIGSLQVEGQVGYADLRPFFAGKTYIGCDMRPGIGVDRIENVEHLTFHDESVGTVLTVDTLEHVENCHIAIQEIHRVLRSGGVLFMISVMDFPVHEHPYDYWRFTPQSFKFLLRDFSSNWVFFQGNPLFPHTVIGLAVKKDESSSIPKGTEELIKQTSLRASSFIDGLYEDPLLIEKYPVHQLHEAYRVLSERDARIREQTDQLREQANQLKEIYKSSAWRLIQHYRKLKERVLPPATRRRRMYDLALKYLTEVRH